jgi:hypothetical protein
MRRRLVDVFLVLALVFVLVSLNVKAEARTVRRPHPICLGYHLIDGGYVIRCYWLGRR